ncbi:hypothetical protein CKC_04495 [Candidatus Liberibacter solanacearum CLso-ZC1]|uniref:Uncharacterized protein n=1 Tax=Liberibacter solanacearum (strain CLso-ZC1) TaxID=658172 RepID=E4UDH0_LIBSC|nr:hypothetical protein CKC_04495 [Candidatus Liberibacter solanacearum CLso-ZC1]
MYLYLVYAIKLFLNKVPFSFERVAKILEKGLGFNNRGANGSYKDYWGK